MSEEVVQISKEEYHQLLSVKEELAQLKRLMFGKKNERFIASDTSQTHLDFVNQAEKQDPSVEQETISYTRNKQSNKNKAVRLLLPSHLPRQEEILQPADKQADAVSIGETVTEILEYKPGKLYVKRFVRPKYVQGEKIIVAPLPTLPIPQGNAGPGLLAYLLISKFIDHLPFYRQVQIFKREGVKLAESTVSGWFRAVCKLLEPLYYELQQQVLSSSYLMADETPLPVQSSEKKGSTHTGYHWVYRSPQKRMVIFDYQKGRSATGPQNFLAGYQGVIQTDGYSGYEWLENKDDVILLSCMAHARRYFEKALENDPEKASYVLGQIQELYKIERLCKEQQMDETQIKNERQNQSLPILNNLHAWLQENYPSVAPKSSIGKAMAYALKFWKRLTRYVENGAWNIDNNLVENSIRPVALGRKNYLFAGSHEAAQQAAMVYSLLGTCKINDIEPYQWLTEVISKIPDTKISDLHKLLPLKPQ